MITVDVKVKNSEIDILLASFHKKVKIVSGSKENITIKNDKHNKPEQTSKISTLTKKHERIDTANTTNRLSNKERLVSENSNVIECYGVETYKASKIMEVDVIFSSEYLKRHKIESIYR